MAENPSPSDIPPSLPQLKTMFAELLATTKDDILTDHEVKESIDQVYRDFEVVEMPLDEADQVSDIGIAGETSSRASLADKIDQLAAPTTAATADEVKALALEFSTAEKTSAALNTSLAELVNGLINEKVPKEKLAHLQEKYLRPDNCPYLISPKINKQIWQQLRQETRNSDSAFQKAKGLLMTGLYAILQLCQNEQGACPHGSLNSCGCAVDVC